MENKVRWPCGRNVKEETYRILMGKAEGKSPFELPDVGCEDITEIEWNVVERIYLAVSGSCKKSNKPSGSKNAERIAQIAEKV
jgi:hypothetical protein